MRASGRVEEHLSQLRLAVSRGALLTYAVATLEARHVHPYPTLPYTLPSPTPYPNPDPNPYPYPYPSP